MQDVQAVIQASLMDLDLEGIVVEDVAGTTAATGLVRSALLPTVEFAFFPQPHSALQARVFMT